MSVNKLKLLPYYHNDYDKIAKEAERSNNFAYNNWWYLHGDLENRLHYDKASMINAKEYPEFIRMIPEFDKLGSNGEFWRGNVQSFNFVPNLYINGIVECEVIGIDEPCVGYFWTADELPLKMTCLTTGEIFEDIHWHQRGLVCLKSDIESCDYALKKYIEKSQII